jgi:transposase
VKKASKPTKAAPLAKRVKKRASPKKVTSTANKKARAVAPPQNAAPPNAKDVATNALSDATPTRVSPNTILATMEALVVAPLPLPAPDAPSVPADQPETLFESIPQILEGVAAIDLGSREHFVAVPMIGPGPYVRSFLSETFDLRNMDSFPRDHGTKTVVMEATGVYWTVPFVFLEDCGYDVRLLDPRSVKNVPGRKTDVSDCQWLRKLASCGLAAQCFVPTREFSTLRGMLRTRATLARLKAGAVNRMIKRLRLQNINLERAVSDITGKTGMSIIDAIIAGERSPLKLAAMRDKRCAKNVIEIARCLEGVYTERFLIDLKIHRDHFAFIERQIEEHEARILDYMKLLESGPELEDSDPVQESPPKTTMDMLGRELVRIVGGGVDLTVVPGISILLALVIISEIGVNMSRWPTVKHFASWLGLCPGSKISGGKVISSASRKVHTPASQAFIMAARRVGRSYNAFGDFYRAKKATRGLQKALTATAHKIARTVYGMLRHGVAFSFAPMEEAEKRNMAKREARLRKRVAGMDDNWFAGEAARRGYGLVREQVVACA